MSVIFGVNLSDRIYIAGDSRVSNMTTGADGAENIIVKHDNMLKVETLKDTEGILVASAGDAIFAQFLIVELMKTDFVKKGIRSLRDNIDQWIRPIAHAFFSQGYTMANLIFAGPDKTRHKTIIGKDLLPLIKQYGGKEDGNSGTIKKVIVDGLGSKGEGVPNPEPELPIDNTMLFSVGINEYGVKITDTKWGEYLIYGPRGLQREDVPLKAIGQLEFDQGAGDPNHDTSLITMLIHDLAINKQLDSVGGCVVVLAAHGDGSTYLMDGDISSINIDTGEQKIINRFRVIGQDFYRRDDSGTLYKLIPVSKHKRAKSGKLLI